MTIGIGLIGAGYWGAHLRRVFPPAGAELRAVADIDADRRAAIGGAVSVHADAGPLWTDPSIDAVLIATPPATHAALARECLLAGKHCWVEKPLALARRDAETLVALAAERRRVLFVDETFLYDPLVRQARAWLRDGLLGELHHLSFQRLALGRIRGDSDVWWNAAPHDLALLRYLVPAPVTAIHLERFAHLRPDLADVCVATLRLDGGVSAHLVASWLSPVKTATVIAVGSRGMLAYEGSFERRSLSRYEYALDRSAPGAVTPVQSFAARETLAGGAEEPLGLAAAAFLHCIRTGTRAPSEGIHSLAVVELLERGERSAAPGQYG